MVLRLPPPVALGDPAAMKLGFLFPGVYGILLSLLILSGNFTDKLICIFCHQDKYTLGHFGEVWANWHAIGCAFVGMMNLSVAKDEDAFGPGKRQVAINTVFIYGVWACQNTYYCINRPDSYSFHASDVAQCYFFAGLQRCSALSLFVLPRVVKRQRTASNPSWVEIPQQERPRKR